MQNLIVTFNIVAPFLLYMLFGILMKRLGFITPEFNDKLNRLVSSTILPIFNFYNFTKADLSALRQGGFIVYVLVGTCAVLIMLIAVMSFLKRTPGRKGAMLDTAFVSNTMVFGIAIALSMYGEGNIAPMILVAAILLPIYNAAVIPVIQVYGSRQALLDIDSDAASGTKISLTKMLKDIITNPLVLAVAAGALCSGFHVKFPVFADSFLSGISATLTPLIFIIMGARFTLQGFRSDARDLLLCLSFKLILTPLIMILLPLKLGYRDITLLSVLMAFSAPSGVTCVPICKSCGCDDSFASEMVATSSGLSIFTVFLWIFILKQFGFM